MSMPFKISILAQTAFKDLISVIKSLRHNIAGMAKTRAYVWVKLKLHGHRNMK